MSESPLTAWFDRDGKLLRLRLARPPANIIDAEMITALETAFSERISQPDLKGILLDHDGPNFSFGASVEEHLPDQCEAMIKGLHAIILRMVECPLPILVVVRGQCLGGGLEIAAAGNFVFAAPECAFGQPEIKLAVFAPAASCLLSERIGHAKAADILFTGRTVSGYEADDIGLVDRVADDPEAAALGYFDKYIAPLSGSSLRYAVRAARAAHVAHIKACLSWVEELYLTGLMQTHDAEEGLRAFIEKRQPEWENR